MGFARLLLAGLGALLVLTLIVIGLMALFGSLSSTEEEVPEDPSVAATTEIAPPPAGDSRAEPATLEVECVAEQCPKVFVRVPGGDVLLDREMAQGERVSFTEPKLDVVLDDAATVRVLVNGEPRAPGKGGERQTFSAARSDGEGVAG
jgi:hypothetical protein